MARYSGTPLLKKLGIVEDSTLVLIDAPPRVVGALPPGVTVKRQARGTADVVVAFFTRRKDFERRIGSVVHDDLPGRRPVGGVAQAGVRSGDGHGRGRAP
jgi:hypothetical protein